MGFNANERVVIMLKYITFFIILTITFAVSDFYESNVLSDVKSGELSLICNDRAIDPDRVTDFVDGRWYFDNGSMINCEVR